MVIILLLLLIAAFSDIDTPSVIAARLPVPTSSYCNFFPQYSKTHLHEESGNQRFANVNVVVFGSEFRRRSFQIEPVHDSRELLPHVVAALQGTVVDEIVVAPLGVFLV